MNFKTQREKNEFASLTDKNAKLKVLLEALDVYTEQAFGKEIMLTRIFCTPGEEDALYVNDPSARPKVSPHEVWQGADLRSSIFTEDEINKVLTYLNSRYKYKNGALPVAFYHKISGNAYHFHVQYV